MGRQRRSCPIERSVFSVKRDLKKMTSPCFFFGLLFIFLSFALLGFHRQRMICHITLTASTASPFSLYLTNYFYPYSGMSFEAPVKKQIKEKILNYSERLWGPPSLRFNCATPRGHRPAIGRLHEQSLLRTLSALHPIYLHYLKGIL